MTKSDSRTAIIIALITLAGTLGAAIITNWDKIPSWKTAPPPASPSQETVPPPASPSQETVPPPTPSQPILQTVAMQPGTGFIFHSQRKTSGTGVDRDIWWNRRELIPNNRMYSLGTISSVEDIVQVASGEFKRGAFIPKPDEGFAVEIKRSGQLEYAILRIISVNDNITFEWLYPYNRQVTGR